MALGLHARPVATSVSILVCCAALARPALAAQTPPPPPPPPSPLVLEWNAPEGCPERAVVLAQAQQFLAMSVPSRPRPALHARATVAQDGVLWKLHLEMASAEGPATRDFQDESCARLGQVAALALALVAESAREPQPPPAPPPKLASPAPSHRFLVRALIGGDLGSLRAPSPGPGLAIGIFLGRARVEAVANYWLPESGGGIQDQLVSAGLHACVSIVDAPDFGVCAGLEGGPMRGQTSAPGSTWSTSGWFATLVGAGLGFELTSWLAVRAEIALGAGDGVTRGGPAPVFGRFVLGVEARF